MAKKRTFSPVTRAIQALGMSPKEFVKKYLDSEYPAFQYRSSHGRLHLDEYQKIMFYTGKSFSQLWPSEWDQKSQHVPLNLAGNSTFKGGILQTNSPEIISALTNHPLNNGRRSVTILKEVNHSVPTEYFRNPPATSRLTPAPQESKKKEETFSSPPAPDHVASPYEFGLPPID